MFPPNETRRDFLRGSVSTLLCAALAPQLPIVSAAEVEAPLQTFGYSDVVLHSERHNEQLRNTKQVLLALDDDSLLRPFRVMGELPAPGEDLGGWYMYKADYDYRKDSAGLCPAGTFGQWISALSRMYAISGDAAARDKVLRLNRLYAAAITDGFFEKNRFPAYCYDKLVCGLIDAHQFAGDAGAFAILDQTTDIALRHLPPHAVDREETWRPGTDVSYTWDESYTLPENLFLAYQRGAGARYRELAVRYLDDRTYFDPLSEGKNVLAGKHAYSYVNALNSAMQAYLILGSDKHLKAAKNAFNMLVSTQSFATGGWGPDEMLRAPGSDDLAESLTKTHSSFETPCGSYAHFKLTRYLLEVTRDAHYGDSMEQVMYNTVLGAMPLQADGTAFYYSDYNFNGRKIYSRHRWPCCSGTLPQVAADYHINLYMHDGNALYVNLYVPSELRWNRAGNRIQLTQLSQYPFSSHIEIRLATTKTESFPMRFRIPAWTQSPSISVNGKRLLIDVVPGSFATVTRSWSSGDRIELEFPMSFRLLSINSRHADALALVYGPLVLFPITEKPLEATRKQLLAAEPLDMKTWRVQAFQSAVKLMPFTEISDQPYTTYIKRSS